MDAFKAHWLVLAWERATDKANGRMWGPQTREACREAYGVLGMPIPDDLGADDDESNRSQAA